MKNKGFTLTELLVVIVILGVITGISIPLIRNLSNVFDRRKYENYADSVLASAKLYNDSYSEDLFGHKEYGCAYITYDELVKRNLLKDIQGDDISCNSDGTYVRVIKQRDKYYYSNFLGCGKKKSGKVDTINVTVPDVVPVMDTSSCTGVDDNNLSINIDESMTDKNISGNPFNKKVKKTKITISSGTGISNNIVIYTKWSTNKDDFNNTGFNKVGFKVKSDQEKKLMNAELINTTSGEITTPEGVSGKYYLIVRVDNLQDLYGSKWKNPDNSDSKYLSFGPFSVDNEKPVIVANAYKCGSDNKKTGNVLKNKSINGNGTLNLFDIAGNVNEWISSQGFNNGVCIGYELSDNGGVKNVTYQENNAGIAPNGANYKSLVTSVTKDYSGSNKNETYEVRIFNDGHRYVRLTVKDIAGNKSYVDVEAKIDETKPVCAWSGESTSWTNSNRTITVTGSDALSGMDDNNKKKEWVYSTGTTKTIALSYDILDKAGNKATCSKTTNVYVDKDKPTCTWTGESTSWTKSNRTIKVTGNDTGSGMDDNNKAKEWAYSTGTTKTVALSYTIKDKVGNQETCTKTVNVYVDKTAPTCGTITKTSTGTAGVSGNVQCSDTTGCNTVSFSGLKSTQNVTIKDGVGNTASCSVNVSTYSCEKYSESYSCNQPVQYDCSYDESYDCSYNENYDCSYNTTSTCTGTKTNSAAECAGIGGRWSQAGYYGYGGQGTCTYTYSCTKKVSQTCTRKVSKTCSRRVSKSCWRDNWVTCWRDAWKTCYN